MFADTKDFRRRLLNWYDRHRRDLPWRIPADPTSARPDPYHVLVSEAMLQQTQVATVIPYFQRFVSRFPTISDLASANPQEVLRLWQGLGYYSRARNLQKTAIEIFNIFNGALPQTVEQLLQLPGIGRYTAGAIASIAFEQRAPILDGNVARVLCRLDCIRQDPHTPPMRDHLWSRAQAILPRKRLGDFNSSLMELGALVCTPKSPKCLACPVRRHCEAYAAGLQEQIPLVRKTPATPLERRWTICICSGQRYLIEQRPPKGRWASMWQFVTVLPQSTVDLAGLLASRFSVQISTPVKLGQIRHALTHRRYEFEAFTAKASSRRLSNAPSTKWVTLQELDSHPLPRPHLLIAKMLTTKKEAPDLHPGLLVSNRDAATDQ